MCALKNHGGTTFRPAESASFQIGLFIRADTYEREERERVAEGLN